MAQFTNQATLSYNGSVVNSNVAVGEILEALSAQKTAVRETYVAGDTITYVISLRNAGAAAWTGLTVSDDLGGICIRHAGGNRISVRVYRAFHSILQQRHFTGETDGHRRTAAGDFRHFGSGGRRCRSSSMRQKPHRMRRRAWKHPLPTRRRLPATPSHR